MIEIAYRWVRSWRKTANPEEAMRHRIIDHNHRVWTRRNGAESDVGTILVEYNGMCSSHVAYSYLANILAEGTKARLTAMVFNPSLKARFLLGWTPIIRNLLWSVGSPHFNVYKSFGTADIQGPSFFHSLTRIVRAWSAAREAIGAEPSRFQFLTMRIAGVPVGDLIYDSYITKYKVAQVDLSSWSFRVFLIGTISDIFYWMDFFAKNRVAGVIVSHSVYNLAIPARIAMSRNVPAYQASGAHIYRLSSGFPRAFQETAHYPSIAKQLESSTLAHGLEEAERRLKRRFSGESGVDMPYAVGSAFVPPGNERVLTESNKPKVLVASHSFFDAPHARGLTIFADFMEWLDFLARFSHSVDYEWYIKPHPDVGENLQVVKAFCAANPQFRLLSSGTSHHQLVREGLDVVLTVYGTVGLEYPMFGVPVINASQVSPHRAYGFNFHAETADEYKGLLEKIPELPKPGDDAKRQVEEFYFMNHIFYDKDLFFEDWRSMWLDEGGSMIKVSPRAYSRFLENLTEDSHNNLMTRILRFISTEAYRLDGSRMLVPSAEFGLRITQ